MEVEAAEGLNLFILCLVATESRPNLQNGGAVCVRYYWARISFYSDLKTHPQAPTP